MSKKSLLIIMDGWGHGKIKSSDAIQHAHVPFVKSLYQQYPHAELITCGELVGLPEGQMGNSEVGHLNIGAGRIVYQELQRINVAIRNGELRLNAAFTETLQYAKTNDKTLHLIGLVSNGGVHSHIEHLKSICSICHQENIQKVMIHVFTDGRDTDPKSGRGFIQELQDHLNKTTGRIASVTGRYYAMDRDKRWERVKIAYDAMVNGIGTKTTDLLQSIAAAYATGITDEFLKPLICIDSDGNPLSTITAGDAVLCFNFRTDRCREITEVLTRIAETEKYPHVTFFFSGGRENEFVGEKRIMRPSPKDVATYDVKPAMSAVELTEAILPEIENERADFICLNFANADMVGHTGVWEAVIKAVETVDTCVERIVQLALKKNYTIFLTADHGNSDYMINEDGTPNTAHTLNPVPFFIISTDFQGRIKNGKLGDIAPTILTFMGLDIPNEMTGDVLV